MATDIGPKIGIQGEAEYKRSMKELAAATKTLGTEAKLITSEFAGEEKSTEALKAKNDVLQRSVYQLNDVMQKQEEYLKKVANAYGEANARTMKAQQDVNKTKTAINNFNAEIRKNNEQISANGTALGKLGNMLGGFTDKLGLGNTALGKMADSMSSGTLAATALSAAVVKLAGDLVKLSDAAAKQADEINTMSKNYGIAVQDLQKFQYMAGLTDTSVETITGSISKLTRSMDSARNGTGSAAEAFSKLGIAVTGSDGSLRSSNEVFMEAIDALGRVGNATERDALAMDIFGKSAMDLNGIIAQGSEGLQSLADEAANSGYVMSDQMIAVLQQGQDTTDRFDKAMEGLKNTIGAGVTPVVSGWKIVVADAADAMSVFIQNLAGMRSEADQTADSVSKTAAEIEKMTDAARGWRDMTAEELYADSPMGRNEAFRQKALDLYQNYPGGKMTYTIEPYSTSQQQPVNVTLEIDKQTLAQVMVDPLQDETNRRGSRATY